MFKTLYIRLTDFLWFYFGNMFSTSPYVKYWGFRSKLDGRYIYRGKFRIEYKDSDYKKALLECPDGCTVERIITKNPIRSKCKCGYEYFINPKYTDAIARISSKDYYRTSQQFEYHVRHCLTDHALKLLPGGIGKSILKHRELTRSYIYTVIDRIKTIRDYITGRYIW